MDAEATLALLLALSGQCFAGEISPATRDTHCLSSVYDGRPVRDVHTVTNAGRTIYQGESIYSVEGDAVTFTYVSSIGGIGRGTAKLDPGDWQFELVMRATPKAEPKRIATRWQWQGRESYTVTGGAAAITYRRSAR